MSLKKFRIAVILTLGLLASLACKKEEETTSYPSLEGNISIVGLEEFVEASDDRVILLKPSGAVHPEGKEMGYCWKVTPGMDKFDTTRFENGLNREGTPSDGSFGFKIKDLSLETYTVYCYAFASDYSSTYAVGYTTLVKAGPNGSIQNTGVYENTEEVEEDNSYRYVTIGNTDWINMNIYEDTSYSGVAFRNANVMSNIFGQYYNYADAVSACNSIGENDWHLPTENDWIEMVKWAVKDNTNAPEIKPFSNIYWDKELNGTPTLASQLMADGYFNSEVMWAYWPAVGDITNRTGLAFIPTGYANLGITPSVKSSYPDACFEGLFDYAVFWTASEVEGEEDMAYYRYVYGYEPHLMIGKGNKESFAASVRCVRNRK